MRKLSTDLIKSGSFTGSFSGSFYGLSPSSSYALTASYSNNSTSASYSLNSTTATNLSGGTVNAISITGSLLGTSSLANNAISSSFSSVSISSSYALTASNLIPIAQDLIPITGSTYSLGSPTNKWKDLYVSTGSIYIGETVLSTSGSTLFANSNPIVTLNTASGQIEVVGITASLSSSFASNANLLNNTSSTVFATTGSNNFSGSQIVQGNITVIGSLIAQQYVVSSSVSYFTSSNFDGSTKFGDTDSDTHQFTGSLRSPNITGSLLGTASIALVALTSSYINVATNAVSSSFASTASVSVSSSYSSYAITSSYVLNSVSSSFTSTSSYSLNSVSSSYSNVANTATSATSANTATSSSFATTAGTATSATSANSANTANSATSASYALTASFALNSSGGGGGSGTVSGSVNYISKFTSGSAIGNSVIYETGSNIGIGTINPNAKLNINSSGSLVSGSVVFSVEGTQGSLFSVDDSLSGSLMSVNDISGLPILEVFSDDRLVVGTYNSNALVVTGSRVGIGTNNPIAKLQVSGNISGSSFTSSVSNGVGFLGTSSFSVTASYALNALTASFALNASGGGGGSGTVTGSLNYISKFTSTTTVGNSVMYETGSNIGIGTINPNAKLNINSSGSLVSGSVVFSVEGTQGSLFSVDDSLSGSLMSVNDISGLPILEVFSDDRLVVGTYNSNALVVTGSRVGIGTNNPIAKLQVNGNISASSFTGSVFGTSSWSTNALSASYAPGGGTTLTTGSTYPITSSWSTTSSNIIGGTSNYIPLWSTNTSLGNSVLYQSSNNIGIGTTSPSYKLDVNGIIAVSNSPFADKTGNYNRIYNPSGDGCIYLGNVSDPGNYYDNTNHYFRNRGNTTTYVTINSNGNVGIGTTSPASILHLQSSAATTLLRIDNTNNANDAAILLTDSTNPTGEGFRITYDSSVGDTYFNNIFTSSIQAFNFQKGDFGSGTSLLTILNSGNVGIGTTSPSAKLHVNGNISASAFTGSVFGTSSWANNATTASFASTASYNLNSISSSYSLTASYALVAGSGGSGGSTSTSSLIGQTFVPTASVSQLSLTQSVSNNDQILVILDGLVQSRTGSYTVTGSTLNLTENADSGSIIDVRFLAGASTVSSSFATTSSYAITTAPRTVIYRYGTTSVVNPGSYAYTIIKYDTAVTDSTGWYDNTTGKFTPTVAGWYQVSAGARVYSSGGEGYLILLKNGTDIMASGGGNAVNSVLSLLVYFNGSSDYIQLYSRTATAITNAQSSGNAPFTMVYMTS